MEKFFDELYQVLENSVSACKSKTIALSGGLDSSIIAYFLKEKNCKAVAVISKDFIASDLTYCQLAAKKIFSIISFNV